MLGNVTVNPQGRTLSVNLLNENGSQATAFLNNGSGTPATLPTTISTPTTFYLFPGSYQLSALEDGLEIAGAAGQTRALVLSAGQGVGIGITRDTAEDIAREARWLDTTTANATYALPAALSVRYVSASGNDAASGLAVGAAKRSLQAAYDALPATGGTVLVAGVGGFDVGAGLQLQRGKPCAFVAPARASRFTDHSAGSFDRARFPVVFSSTNAAALVFISQPETVGNGYGFTFTGLAFELTGAAASCAIYAECVNDTLVQDCTFLAAAAVPIDCVAIRTTVNSATGDDASWWRLLNNTVSGMGLCVLGNTGNSNQHVVFGNKLRGKGTVGAAPAIELRGNHRSWIGANNVEIYETGILISGSSQCYEAGDAGEAVDTFLRILNSNTIEAHPLGISVPTSVPGRKLAIIENSRRCLVDTPAVGPELGQYPLDAITEISGSVNNTIRHAGTERVSGTIAAAIVNQVTASHTSTSFTDVPGASVTFTVPSNGKVIIEASAGFAIDASNSLELNLRNGTSDVAGTTQRVARGASDSQQGRFTYRHHLAGLTPGASVTYKLGARRGDGSGTVTVVADIAGTWGQLVMEVRSLPFVA